MTLLWALTIAAAVLLVLYIAQRAYGRLDEQAMTTTEWRARMMDLDAKMPLKRPRFTRKDNRTGKPGVSVTDPAERARELASRTQGDKVEVISKRSGSR